MNRVEINKINELINIKDYEGAINECNKCLKANPNNAVVYYLLGEAYMGLRKFDDAFLKYMNANKIDPLNDKYMFAIANMFLKHLKNEAFFVWWAFYHNTYSVELIDKAISRNPNNSNYHHCKGEILYYLGKYEASLEALDKSIEYSSENSVSYYYKALCLIKLDKFQEAVLILNKAIQINPYPMNFHNTLIDSFMERDAYDKALKAIECALNTHPNEPKLLLKKFRCYSELRQFKEAIEIINTLIKMDSCNYNYYYQKAYLFLKFKTNYAEALQMIDNALRGNPESYDCLEVKGVILQRLERYSESTEVFIDLIHNIKAEIEKRDSQIAELSVKLEDKNDPDKTFNKYFYDLYTKQKSELEQTLFRLYYSVSKSYYKMNEYDEALKYCDIALNYDSEKQALKELRRDIADMKQIKSVKSNFNSQQDDFNAYMSELNSLIGLECVKSEIRSLISFIQVQKLRESYNMPALKLTNHLVFTGNPGTGKTTVARILGKLYKSIGVLSKGHFVEVDRSGLVAGYVGHTALKTKDKIQEALGGILFIDEAYSLVSENTSNDFGKEAIETLLKAMEDYREDLIVIVAGYPEKMESFINSNEGLRSRFNNYIHFEDYNPTELYDIFISMCDKNGYTLSNDADMQIRKILNTLYENRGENFGNGRTVRNIFEKAILNQSTRVLNSSWNKESLSKIEAEDLTIF